MASLTWHKEARQCTIYCKEVSHLRLQKTFTWKKFTPLTWLWVWFLVTTEAKQHVHYTHTHTHCKRQRDGGKWNETWQNHFSCARISMNGPAVPDVVSYKYNQLYTVVQIHPVSWVGLLQELPVLWFLLVILPMERRFNYQMTLTSSTVPSLLKGRIGVAFCIISGSG
jgi:hypothetical protein